jgi:hypothetical protein
MDNEVIHWAVNAGLGLAAWWLKKTVDDGRADRLDFQRTTGERIRILELDSRQYKAEHDTLERILAEFKVDLTRHLEKQDRILEGIAAQLRQLDQQKVDRDSITGKMAIQQSMHQQ